MYKKLLLALLITGSLNPVIAQETPDANVIQQIRREGLEHSKVMEHAFWLTDVNGPRLANSPGLKRAEEWAVNTLKTMGLQNAHLEPWGEFGRGWEIERCYVAMKSPYYQALIATPKAWSGSTNGEIKAEVVLIKADTTVIKQMGSKLAGKIVIFDTKTQLEPNYTPDATRFTDQELKRLDSLPPLKKSSAEYIARIRATQKRLTQLLYEQKVALVLDLARGDDGTVFTSSPRAFGLDDGPMPAELEVSSEHYLRIVRLIKSGRKVELEADVRTKFITDDPKGYNVIAEIPGTDPKLKKEVVMLGAHLDSWHAATGATDNAAGCAVMMEVVRIIKTLDLKPRRTIRIALWSSEEEGLWGSKGYVANHFGDVTTMKLKPEQANISAYYNLDNGTGRLRGIFAQQNVAVRPIFDEWLKPFHDLGATTTTLRNTGSTDHISFDDIGIPGFQFIQDRVEYFSRTHHSNQDTYDRLVADDLKQAATIVASFVYNTAQRDQKLPRKPLIKK
ncbi:M20/M25/M40 family metallo-hydrolase [Pedobacter sp. BS3]|uniref:M28 family metallopeptidase n=1 Tax=Pedobacter sp. BS3 TaxID=2567937 RepID=UPI0011F02BE3|nr:M20/M25/M40 family metallo-hydrolase [Pedobacter sp. BS3]TZF84850.1 M20/M25/M40 family metallo-hydrolase [Pedobacter sp. BS3]